MLKASLGVQLFGKERNSIGNLKATTTQMKNVGLTFSIYLANTETVTFKFQCIQRRYDWCKYKTAALNLYFVIQNNNTLLVKLEFTNKIGIKYDRLLHHTSSCCFNHCGSRILRRKQNQNRLFNTYFAMKWNPPQKIEIKQSILNPFCNYSTFSLIKQDCDCLFFHIFQRKWPQHVLSAENINKTAYFITGLLM